MVCCVFILNLRLAFKVNFLRDWNGCFYKRIVTSEVRELVHGLGKVEQLGIVSKQRSDPGENSVLSEKDPVVKTPGFHSRGRRLGPGGELSCMPWSAAKKF